MIYVPCRACRKGLRISPGSEGEAEHLFGPTSEYYPDKYPCPHCGMPCTLSTLPVEGVVMLDVSPVEAFVAFHGIGLPDEHDCGTTAVEAALLGKRIKRVETRHINNSHRCAIDHVEFEDGSKMYFGASMLGATVYRISHPASYAEKVDV